MTIIVNAKYLLTSLKEKSLLFQSNEEHSNVMILEEIPWESLTHSNSLHFKRLTLPNPIEVQKPLLIMQDDKGNVRLQFTKREGSNSRISTLGSRASSSPRPSYEYKTPRTFVKLENVDFTPNIPQPRYVTQESLPTSPTYSQMIPE